MIDNMLIGVPQQRGKPEFPVIANQSSDWCGNLPDFLPISRTF